MLYKEEKYNEKEILVRKVQGQFVEKLFQFLNYDIHHDRIKKIFYGDDYPRDRNEAKAKNVFDAFVFLINNAKTNITQKLLNTFFYIYFSREIDETVALRIASDAYAFVDKPAIESAVDLHLAIYDELDICNYEDKFIISMCFLNFYLIKNNIPVLRMHVSELQEYVEKRKAYRTGDKLGLYTYIIDLVNNAKTQTHKYYEELNPLTVEELVDIFKADEEMIKSNFGITHLSIFGSFAKQLNRIDSDVDLIISFNFDLTSKDKHELAEQFKRYYVNKLKRFIDICEISQYLDDLFIQEKSCAKRVF